MKTRDKVLLGTVPLGAVTIGYLVALALGGEAAAAPFAKVLPWVAGGGGLLAGAAHGKDKFFGPPR